ncbi:hypothetical protein RI578_06735 [Streptomyces sp. BB1-1-1]|uniref:hypothetical protein n=1 Tax=Streptomyces sp. BB1-1-1 TaxID=3074430 RepID=UPI0028774000|nr:hypothetical protein [Streptomyces sp. BB1-1-1]WND34009.1 hypothetical protein RI578_06735 [Streptomyces sp. BB1-1-1]
MSTTPTEFQADAGARRALEVQLYTLVGRPVAEIRITRVKWPEGKRWVALALAPNRREIPMREGGLHHQAAVILRHAFPSANWAVAQDYDVATGTLRQHVTPVPASLRRGRR